MWKAQEKKERCRSKTIAVVHQFCSSLADAERCSDLGIREGCRNSTPNPRYHGLCQNWTLTLRVCRMLTMIRPVPPLLFRLDSMPVMMSGSNGLRAHMYHHSSHILLDQVLGLWQAAVISLKNSLGEKERASAVVHIARCPII